MKIIIVGAGKVGKTVTELLVEEGHDITVIDRDPNIISAISNSLDVICVEGNAADPETMSESGVSDADLVMAATEKDEVNMVCGVCSSKMGAKHIIARIRDPQYLHQSDFLREALGLSYIINPEYECAKEISRILHFPGAAHVDSFSKGSVEIVEHKIPENGKLDQVPLNELSKRFGARVLVALIERDANVLIPNGDTVLKKNDRLSITGSPNELRRFFHTIGELKKPVRRVMIVGGSRIAVYLSRMLIESGISVTVIERDRSLCDKLCDMIPDAQIVCGDATHSEVLNEDGIATTDAFVALTGDDGDNIITSLYAKTRNVNKVVLKVNREHFIEILGNSGLDSIVSPKTIVAQQLVRYVRAISNSSGSSSIEMLYRLADGKIEALEFQVSDSSVCINKPIRELKLRPNILLTAVIRDNHVYLPNGDTKILPSDHVVVVANAGKLRNFDEILDTAK